ncbi:electron transfer flavoprotein subunit alpha/FixB family protein [uncultured Sphaerochaeta sp.]|uniref:electron transfer flavoprotein subunit alpha/FixB family protein n=1 Tax=uncultured Sphaerochaeta sp. TaxID=886478 RepID=UPI002A0A956E|nr:electron transfer flavoprotein subunit alpha/FixB family protein [uncultured Sphaerochaeta sp.]
MNDIWTLSEQHEGRLKDVSFELLARGRALADEVGCKLCAVILGNKCTEAELSKLFHHGADIVYYVEDPCLGDVVCETYANVLAYLISEYKPQVLLSAATTTGRSLLPYLAVRIKTGLTADCTELAIEKGTGNLLQTRPAIGGNIMATIKTPNHRPQMATVRPKSCRALAKDEKRTGELVHITWNPAWYDKRVQVLSTREEIGNEVSLEEADIVVAGGRGLKKRDNFHLVDELASCLGGQVGASRDAVDRGWKSYPHQVGLSGKTISPKLYIGIGISGAVQHLAGIKTAECIVAINNDENANLLQVADFAIVGDLFAIIPELLRRLGTQDREK